MQRALQTRALNKYLYSPNCYLNDYKGHRVYQAIHEQTNVIDEAVYIKSYQLRSQYLCGNVLKLTQEDQRQLEVYGGIGKHLNIQEVIALERSQHCVYVVMERGRKIGRQRHNNFNSNRRMRMELTNIQSRDYINIFNKFIDVVTAVCHLRSKGYIHCGIRQSVIEQYQNKQQNNNRQSRNNKIYKLGSIQACLKQNDSRSRASLKNKLQNRVERDNGDKDCNRIMAPQILDYSQSTQKSMIWDLGILLYYWIFNKVPIFDHLNTNNSHSPSPPNINPNPSTPHNINNNINKLKNKYKSHPIFQTLLLGCLRINPISRFSLNQLLRCILNSNYNYNYHYHCDNSDNSDRSDFNNSENNNNQQYSRQFQYILLDKIYKIKESYTVPQSQWVFQKYNHIKEIESQVYFIRFLARTCYLVQKSYENQIILRQQLQQSRNNTQNEHILSQIQQNYENAVPIQHMTKFIIKCRLKYLDRKVKELGSNYGDLNVRFKYQIQELRKQFMQENKNDENQSENENENHSQHRRSRSESIYHEKLQQLKKYRKQAFQTNPQYRQFNTKNYNFNELTYLHYQSYLRQYIIHELQTLQYNISLNKTSLSLSLLLCQFRYSIYSIDFTISILQLNQQILQKCEKHNWNMLNHHNMNIYAEESLKNNLQDIYRNILRKVTYLGINAQN